MEFFFEKSTVELIGEMGGGDDWADAEEDSHSVRINMWWVPSCDLVTES